MCLAGRRKMPGLETILYEVNGIFEIHLLEQLSLQNITGEARLLQDQYKLEIEVDPKICKFTEKNSLYQDP